MLQELRPYFFRCPNLKKQRSVNEVAIKIIVNVIKSQTNPIAFENNIVLIKK